MTDYRADFSGPMAMQEEDLCQAVGEDLTKHYPGHPWCVGADLVAGSVVIDLGYKKPVHLQQMAYLLHPATLMGPGGHHRVMEAGGELLERFGLPREGARKGSGERAADNGLIAGDTAEGAWVEKKAADGT